MRKYQLFVLDLDGTMYRGTEKIEEAPLFVQRLIEKGQEHIFLTNNSTKTPADVIAHLARFGIPATERQIYTSSLAAAHYVQSQKRRANVYAIGEQGLIEALRQTDCRLLEREEDMVHCDFVVQGLDRQITYEKLALATLAVRNGAAFISTNCDKAVPTERGLLPGNGALTSVIATATGKEPLFIGKPEILMMDQILDERGLEKQDVLMIGDNYETDILTGIRAGVDTALVFTGFTKKEDIASVAHVPTYQWDTLLDCEL